MSDQQPRALVTGATGFVGAHMVERLQAEGWDVQIIVRHRAQNPGGTVRIYEYDGRTESLLAAVAESRPDVVFHLASCFVANHSSDQIEPLVATNVLFGTQLLEAMNVHGVKRLVNVGSYWQHFENREYDPVCLYAATKQAFETLLAYFVNARDFSAVTLTLFDTYGPGDPRPKLLQFLHAAALDGNRIQMSPGEQQLSFVYIDDVLDAFMLAAQRLLAGSVQGSESFVVDADRPIRIRDLVRVFSKAIGKPIHAEWGAQPYRSRQIMVPYSGGIRLPGWKPKIKLEDGLRRLCSGYSLSSLRLGSQTDTALTASGISDAITRH
jgi:nucleoside-diphosphate-sugar epimerase